MVVADKPFTTQGGTWMPVYYPGQYPISALSVDAPLIAFLGPDGDGSWQEEALAIVARERPKAHCACLAYNADPRWNAHALALKQNDYFSWISRLIVETAAKENHLGCLIVWLPYMDPSARPTDAVTRQCLDLLARNGSIANNPRITFGHVPNERTVYKYLTHLKKEYGVTIDPRHTLQKAITVGIGRLVNLTLA
jgi:hypothetical protein